MEKQIRALINDAEAAQELLDLTQFFARASRHIPESVLTHQSEMASDCRRGAEAALQLSQILESLALQGDTVVADARAKNKPAKPEPGKVHVTLGTGRTVTVTCVSDSEWSLELPLSEALTAVETRELGEKIAQLHVSRHTACSCGSDVDVDVDIKFKRAEALGDQGAH